VKQIIHGDLLVGASELPAKLKVTSLAFSSPLVQAPHAVRRRRLNRGGGNPTRHWAYGSSRTSYENFSGRLILP
jgi:hypothetical protein